MAFRSFKGIAAARVLFTAILDTYEDFQYIDVLRGEHSLALVFRAELATERFKACNMSASIQVAWLTKLPCSSDRCRAGRPSPMWSGRKS